MKIKELQDRVDSWIKTYGVRYFDEKTNTLLLVEEVGEFSRLISRKYGEQSFKQEISEKEIAEKIEDEIADIVFVITCLANQMEIDLEKCIIKNINKKTNRDHSRHLTNRKLDN
jgi:NTP pyrophosphatase (non-canonical NTP hydrolase)